MASDSQDYGNRRKLFYNREQFADYWTALIARVRQTDDMDGIYAGTIPHPLIGLVQSQAQQIRQLQVPFVSNEELENNPLESTDRFIKALTVAAVATGGNRDYPLYGSAAAWRTNFADKWSLYKQVQRKIYATVVATLEVGSSISYARSVPYGAGTLLLNRIYRDNHRNSTRALFALLTNLFSLRLKEAETFENYHRRFQAITNRFSNWTPPIILPGKILLFLLMRNLPDPPFGAVRHIIMASENITLDKGTHLLRDVGNTDAKIITATLGSGSPAPTVTAGKIMAVTPSPIQKLSAEQKRQRKMTALCKAHGPCKHHGPKSLHATMECRDPQLANRKKKNGKQQQRDTSGVNTVATSPQPPAQPGPAAPGKWQQPAPMGHFMPPQAAAYPPIAYHNAPYFGAPGYMPPPTPGFHQPNMHGAYSVTHPMMYIQAATWNILSNTPERVFEIEDHPEHKLLSLANTFPGNDFSHAPRNSPFSPSRIDNDVLDKVIQAYKNADKYHKALVCTSDPLHLAAIGKTPCKWHPPTNWIKPLSQQASIVDSPATHCILMLSASDDESKSSASEAIPATIGANTAPEVIDLTSDSESTSDKVHRRAASASATNTRNPNRGNNWSLKGTKASRRKARNRRNDPTSAPLIRTDSASASFVTTLGNAHRSVTTRSSSGFHPHCELRGTRSSVYPARLAASAPRTLGQPFSSQTRDTARQRRKSSASARPIKRDPSTSIRPPAAVRAPRTARPVRPPQVRPQAHPYLPLRPTIRPQGTRLMQPVADFVRDTTDHFAARESPAVRAHLRNTTTYPILRRARSVFAYAQGMHTRHHYPQRFVVQLLGEPAIREDWSSTPCMVTGHKSARLAIQEVLKRVANRRRDPRSLCNHVGCIYNQGDLLTRRRRHELSIEHINRLLAISPPANDARWDDPRNHPRPPASHGVHVLGLTQGSSHTILDSGAGRHVHHTPQDFQSVTPCSPQSLQGFTGAPITVSSEGTVGNFTNVLLVPGTNASVRSVGYALDRRGGNINFSATQATYVCPRGTTTVIARRGENGLYNVISGAIPAAPSIPIMMAAPIHVRREAVHRLHRCLGHASVKRMTAVIKRCPRKGGSLTLRDLSLFTNCPSCALGNSKKTTAPSKSSSRSTLFGFRLHADTTGVIRPGTASGYKRILVVVDDATRWVFVRLLKTASMVETGAALRSILIEVAGDAKVLRTQVLRSDNGTEFCNRVVSALLVEAGIRHERTCPDTSHQNGVAERYIGKLVALIRVMLADARLHPSFWGEASMAAAHISNRMPTSANEDNASPFRMRYLRAPNLGHLQPYGITAYVHRMYKQPKVLPRADLGILIGYGHEVTCQKGYRIYLVGGRKVVTTSNVSFGSRLQESVHRRPSAWISTELPEFISEEPAADDDDALSRHIIQHATPAPIPPAPPASTTLQLPQTASPAAPHPLCARGSGPLLVPSQHVPAVSPVTSQVNSDKPRTRSATAATRATVSHPGVSSKRDTSASFHPRVGNSKPSWADVLKQDSASRSLAKSPIRRPVGRPPSGHKWNGILGKYVPVNYIVCAPQGNTAWVLAALNPDLVSSHQTPLTYHDAINSPDKRQWAAAISDELKSLRDCSVYRLITFRELPRGAKPIPCKWVFKIKGDNNGKVTRFKARLVACGYRQRFGRDYNRTYSPVAHAASIRLLLVLAATHGYCLRQFDIKTAFLYGRLPESQRVFLEPPQGLQVPQGTVLSLQRALYGLKQAPLLFNQHLHAALSHLNFKRCIFDPCVYHRRDSDGTFIMLAIVVDDILLTASSPHGADAFATTMRKTYNMSDLGVPSRMVGLAINISASAITLDQNQFIRDLAATFRQQDSNPVHTPCVLGTVAQGDSPLLPPDNHYLSLVGSLLWATISRPDIAVAVSKACAVSKSPTRANWKAAIRILRYLLSTPSVTLTFTRPRSLTPAISVYVDSAWANENESKSRFGFAVMVYGNPVLWKTQVSKMVCLSTAEAEFVAAVEACKAALWISRMFAELMNMPSSPVTVLEDNQACIRMIENPVVSARNRHFAMRMWWLRQQAEDSTITLRHVPSRQQLADIFTKVLPAPTFTVLRDALMAHAPLPSLE